MYQVSENIYFDESLSFNEQSEEFINYAQSVFSTIDFTDMSNMQSDNTCTWTVKKDGLRFIAKRKFINSKMYTVKEHLFNVEIIE
ncbi:hypothetical protein [Plebeiibacterium sediminum]|uniref:Uncharacterized protein n=1 Tax=Plebeiibacterium sediminum TaxID=2992112 RepID=A0AAE3SED0_9BACT|nr:hypothetical protein [Plebeiobacterium sediminum]MCW3784938.1 hypothetical protein [Plebeiobacterium sediminum]